MRLESGMWKRFRELDLDLENIIEMWEKIAEGVKIPTSGSVPENKNKHSRY